VTRALAQLEARAAAAEHAAAEHAAPEHAAPEHASIEGGPAEAQHENDHMCRQRVEPPRADLFVRPFAEISVGDRFATGGRAVSEGDILHFAGLTGDRHPQHTDPNWAAGSRFGEQIAHGLLVLSFAVGLLPLDPDRIIALRRVGDAVFKQPVKIGDTVHVEGEIVRTQEVDREQGLVEARLRIVNDSGRLVVRANVELVWRR
jgi:3-hydroxybutyryl-CoA dehydratase